VFFFTNLQRFDQAPKNGYPQSLKKISIISFKNL
jgi:hypothetical protein